MATQSNFAVLELFPALARTATANGTGVDLQDYVNVGGRQMKAYLNVGAKSGTSPTLTVKMQDSTDNSTFTDISGATFTQATTTTTEEIHFQTTNRYVRAVATIGGSSPSFTFSTILLAEKRTT